MLYPKYSFPTIYNEKYSIESKMSLLKNEKENKKEICRKNEGDEEESTRHISIFTRNITYHK